MSIHAVTVQVLGAAKKDKRLVTKLISAYNNIRSNKVHVSTTFKELRLYKVVIIVMGCALAHPGNKQL